MRLSVRPLHPTLAAEISGVDIAAGVDAATAAELEAASDRYPVLVLPGQNRRANAAMERARRDDAGKCQPDSAKPR
jgi:alpha-ketoglutarate-dependent taurine dioxygenase